MGKKRSAKKTKVNVILRKKIKNTFKGMFFLFILSAIFAAGFLYSYGQEKTVEKNPSGFFLSSQKGILDVFVRVVASNSPIIVIDPQLYVCENQQIDYFFNVSDDSGNVPIGNLDPQDPFFLLPSFTKLDFSTTRFEIYSPILDKNNTGGVNNGNKTYGENISMTDPDSGLVDLRPFNITVLEINNAPVIDNIGVQTVWTKGENSSFNYSVIANDIEDGDSLSGNLIFNINFSGKKLFDINPFGEMDYIGNSSDIGVHNISVCVKDLGIKYPSNLLSIICPDQTGNSKTTCSNFSLTVTDENRPPKIINYSPENLSLTYSDQNDVDFNITDYDPDGTIPDVYWYVDGVLKKYDSMVFASNFSFSYICGFNGKSNITAEVTDGLLNDSVTWNLTVSTASCPVASGGGGGGGGGVACSQKWACNQWSECYNLKSSHDSGKINYKLYSLVKDRCSIFKWDDSNCGIQLRECNDLKKCNSNSSEPGIAQECQYVNNPGCSDGIKNCHNNSCEIGVDCGGPCAPCATCSDGVKNQNEEGVDCGGPCSPCIKETPKQSISSGLLFTILLYTCFIFLILCLIGAVFLGVRYYILKRKLSEVSKNPYETNSYS